MEKISLNSKEIFGIITKLEDVAQSFNGLGDGLEVAMLDDDLEMYEKAEWLLSNSIGMLKKLTGYPQKAN
jgi:hypothetical protein